jgi:tRNA threonylcarbamoyladenosine biosynthesis protein TsaE
MKKISETFELSEEQLDTVCQKLSKFIEEGKIILLKGNLGAGKTTLVRETCKTLNIHESVSSPSFGLINEYESPEGLKLAHMDLYRIEDAEEFWEIGGGEYLKDNYPLIIEWPEIIEHFLQSESNRIVEVEIKHTQGFDYRIYCLSYYLKE